MRTWPAFPIVKTLAEMRALELWKAKAPAAERRYLQFKPLWQRALIVVAGPAANFLLAIFLFALIFSTVGTPSTPFRIAAVEPASAAAQAGFQVNDKIVAADSRKISGFEDLRQYLLPRDGVPIDFEIQRSGQRLHLIATPKRGQEETGFGGMQNKGVLGVLPKPDGRLALHASDPVTAGRPWRGQGHGMYLKPLPFIWAGS